MLYYLATPYAGHPAGKHQAFNEASEQAAFLLTNRISVFCPIAHSHPISLFVDRDGDYDFWLGLDKLFLDRCVGLIVCMLPGWQNSRGVQWEIDYTLSAGKKVFHMYPFTLPIGIASEPIGG